jgi:hypothetical protein
MFWCRSSFYRTTKYFAHNHEPPIESECCSGVPGESRFDAFDGCRPGRRNSRKLPNPCGEFDLGVKIPCPKELGFIAGPQDLGKNFLSVLERTNFISEVNRLASKIRALRPDQFEGTAHGNLFQYSFALYQRTVSPIE